jgi:hypothetical protein
MLIGKEEKRGVNFYPPMGEKYSISLFVAVAAVAAEAIQVVASAVVLPG